ncbi:ACT domain-containing protein [Nocardioides daejeonensis]|uniref:ACT domain-containing protein n=1 Tax=Nocardioides daejeonensis TaxID=1046556 RepID=UPI000D748EAA|nr:ACT domain-containing protein [Nocardioides daejeonensis]
MSAESSRGLTLAQFPEKLAVVHLGPGSEVPAWAESSSIFSVTATAIETSVICASRSVPTKSVHRRPFTGFAVASEIDPADAGTLVELLTPLVEAEIPVFVHGTHETIWLLVPVSRADEASEEWRRRGHKVGPAIPVTTRPGKSRK